MRIFNIFHNIVKKISRTDSTVADLSDAISAIPDTVIDMVYPIGSVYMSVGNTNPEVLFGGTWEQIEDTFLLSAGSTYTAGDTGGEATHTLSTGEMPAHTHGSKSLSGTLSAYTWSTGSSSGIVTKETPYQNMDMYGGSNIGHNYYTINATHEHNSVGSGTAHNNMPPYLVVYMWKRIA